MKKLIIFLLVMKFTCAAFCQVNFQSGGATFSLPMFNWQDDKSRLNFAIGLSYNSGNGLKVNDVASNVGQGWNLLAGGSISRMQVGEPDDQKAYGSGSYGDLTKYPNGYLYNPVDAANGCPASLKRYPIFKWENQLYKNDNIAMADREQDKFAFQINGRSGFFVLGKNNGDKGVLLENSKLKVWFERNETMAGTVPDAGIRTTISAFFVQDENGLIYKFDKYELTKVLKTNYCDVNLAQKQNQPDFNAGNVYHDGAFDNHDMINPYVINAWYLTQIEDPLTNRSINISYSAIPNNINANAGTSLTHYSTKDYVVISHNYSYTHTPVISTIYYPDGHQVNFNYGSARIDLNGDNVLSSVDVLYQGDYLSRYQLNSAYFILNRVGMPSNAFQKSVARLCLQSVKKFGVDLKDEEPPYRFEYFTGSGNVSTEPNENTLGLLEDVVPPPYFHLKDIWGYYNGNNSTAYNGTTKVPINTPLSQLDAAQIKGLCFMREGSEAVALNAKPGYAKNGLLKKIIYPTGGTLSYQYDQNVGIIGGVSNNVGGVHVSSTSVTDGSVLSLANDCNNPIVTNYTYLDNNGQSSLWGLESPVNVETVYSHYAAELRKFRWFSFTCKWQFMYPGIMSREQANSIKGREQFLVAFSMAMQVFGTVMNAIDIIKVCISATGPNIAAIVIDVIAIIVGAIISCTGATPTQDMISTTHFNWDKNNGNPLPMQFKQVTTSESSGGNGKTVMRFTSDEESPIWVPTNPTFSMKPRYAHFSYGLPLKTTILDVNDNLIKETVNNYNFNKEYVLDGHPGSSNYGLNRFTSCKCNVIKSSSQRITDWQNQPTPPYQTVTDAEMQVEIYKNQFGHISLSSTTEKIYKPGSNTDFLQTTTNYGYNNNYLLSTIGKNKTNGDYEHTAVYYNSDFTGNALDILTQNNIFSIPVTTINTIYKPTLQTTLLTNEIVNEYQVLSNGDVKPARTLMQRLTSPKANFNTYNGPGNSANPIYKETQSFTYDATGNLIGLKDEGNHIVTNIYDYDDKFVVASVVNADPILDNVAYSSFENYNNGKWNVSGFALIGPATNGGVTGGNILSVSSSNNITASLNSAKPYIVSYWSDNGAMVVSNGTIVKTGPLVNGFTYYEHNIPANNSSVTITNNSTKNIDELRLYPQSSRMRTVTYDPLRGKTSECDENNRITNYTYDELGRLRFIKDESGNIIKMYEYNYAKKQNGCNTTYTNTKVAEIFYRENCDAGYIGAPYPYIIEAGKYSSTTSQEAVDKQVQYELDNLGQASANANGGCVRRFSNLGKSQVFEKHSCAPGYLGANVTYIVPAGIYFSTVSQAAADALEQADINANGQVFANESSNSNCTITTIPDWESTGVTECEYVNGRYTGNQLTQFLDENPNSATYNQTQMINTGTTIPSTCVETCSLTGAPHWVVENSNISASGSTISFHLSANNNFDYGSWPNPILIANINGPCKPSANWSSSFVDINGRSWTFTINTSGQVFIQLISGSAPGLEYSLTIPASTLNL